MRLCRCGALVEDSCKKCKPPQVRGTTAERGYDHRWRQLSIRYRAAYPLCQVCEFEQRIEPADHVHHIVKITDAEHLRLEWSNLLAVCESCHERVENDAELAYLAKRRLAKW